MTIDLTYIIQAIIGLLAALITYRLIPWIKANTTVKQQELLNFAVRTAVFAAEQMYGSKSGQEKLDYAFTWLTEHGYNADRAQIEACVKKYFPKEELD